jgi:site-specific recombinase XerD
MFKRGSVWWMSYICNGVRCRRSTGTANKKLALKIQDKVRGEIAEGRWFEKLPGEENTFQQLMEKYLSEHSLLNKAPRSHERDKSLADHLIKYFGSMKLAEITPSSISAYKTNRRAEGVAPKTINNELILMGHAFSLAIKEWEWVRENPVRRVSKEKVDNQVERWLTKREEQALLFSSPKWLRQIIVFAIYTGLRQAEILDLEWSQVDLFGRTLTILKQKNKAKDVLPLNKRALSILKQRARVRDRKTNYVYYNGNAARIDARNLLRAFYSALKKSKIAKARFHDLRHTFATRLIQAGVDIYTVQKLGRWKTITMVMRYAHHYPESLRSGIETLDRLPAAKPKNQTSVTIRSQSKKKGIAHDAQPLEIIGSGGLI